MRGKPAVLKRADSRIRLFCRRLTGKQRIVLTSVVSLLFTAACLYSVVSSVSRLGERKGDMKTGHIRPVMLRPETTTIHSNIQKHENGLSESFGEGISTLNPLPFSFSALSFSDGLNTSRRNPAHSRQKNG